MGTDSEGETPADTTTMTVTRIRTRVATASSEPPGGVRRAAVVREESLIQLETTRVEDGRPEILTLRSPQSLPRMGMIRRTRTRRRKRRKSPGGRRAMTSQPHQALRAAITPATILTTEGLVGSSDGRRDARGTSLMR